MIIPLRFKRLVVNAFEPIRATPGSACFDLHYVGDKAVVLGTQSKTHNFATGLAFEVPPGYAMLIFSRSGHGFKHDTRLANCVGVIDSDYRGEVMVKLRADDNMLKVSPGDRIAQAMLVPVPLVQMVEMKELSSTERGLGGFGSTGA